MKRLLLPVLCCVTLGTSWSFGAEETPATSLPAEEEDPIIAEARQAAEEDASRAANVPDGGAIVTDDPSASEDTFIPTVQISEDLSVSFPVDI